MIACLTVPYFAANIQVNEAVKVIVGSKSKFINKMFYFDQLNNIYRIITVKKDPKCKACSKPNSYYFKKAEYDQFGQCSD